MSPFPATREILTEGAVCLPTDALVGLGSVEPNLKACCRFSMVSLRARTRAFQVDENNKTNGVYGKADLPSSIHDVKNPLYSNLEGTALDEILKFSEVLSAFDGQVKLTRHCRSRCRPVY